MESYRVRVSAVEEKRGDQIGLIAARRYYLQDRSDRPRPKGVTVKTELTRLFAGIKTLDSATTDPLGPGSVQYDRSDVVLT